MSQKIHMPETLRLLLQLDRIDMQFIESYVAALEYPHADCISRLLVELEQRPSAAPRHGPSLGAHQFSLLKLTPN